MIWWWCSIFAFQLVIHSDSTRFYVKHEVHYDSPSITQHKLHISLQVAQKIENSILQTGL